jgi:hypothetical protein
MRHLLLGLLAATILFATACGASSLNTLSTDQVATPATPVATGMGALQFPTDGVQPWERLDGAGHVIPAAAGRSASAGLGPNSEFQTGSQRFLEGGGFSDLGAGTKLDSPAGGPLAYATYRLSLGAAQPGVVTVDANLHGAGAQYYVAVSDFLAGRWRWHGPFTEAQVTLPVPAGDATSTLGNTFVAVAAYDGAEIDVVGVGVTARAVADTTAPPAPAAPVATGVVGGVELTWVPVVAGDLAGYRVHYSHLNFTSLTAPGVQTLAWLEGTTRLILPADPARITYVALSAVDISGNASALSPTAFAVAEAGAPPAVQLTTSLISGKLNDAATLTASGASSYDFDLDGDGVFEVTGNTSGTAQVDTSQTGLIRPRVRGTGSSGTSVAMGSVSLLISGNQRPVAYITTTAKTWGAGPLPVVLLGSASTDFDGTIEEWAWDGEGDGIFDQVSATYPNFSGVYVGPDLYAVRLRVTDDAGDWDVDTISVEAQKGTLDMSYEPSLQFGDHFEVAAVYHGWEAVTQIDWDVDGDGTAEGSLPPGVPLTGSAGSPGPLRIIATAQLSTGAVATGVVHITVHGWAINSRIGPPDGVLYPSGALFHEEPALCYIDGAQALKFIRGNSNPSNWTAPVDVAPGDLPYKCAMVTLADDSVGIAYTDSVDNDLCYVRALDAAGSTWSAPITLENNGITVNHISAAVINGNPAVAYYHNGLTDPLFIRASDALGASWDAPVVIENVAANDGQRISLAQVNGKPAVAFASDGTALRYAQAADANGAVWQASIGIDVLIDVDDQPLALADINGRPAIAATYNVAPQCRLNFYRANDPDGSDWTGSFDLAAQNITGVYAPALALVGQVPMITYNDGTHQYLVRSNTVNGQGWNTEQVMFTSLLYTDSTSVLFDYDSGRAYVAQANFINNSLSVGILF